MIYSNGNSPAERSSELHRHHHLISRRPQSRKPSLCVGASGKCTKRTSSQVYVDVVCECFLARQRLYMSPQTESIIATQWLEEPHTKLHYHILRYLKVELKHRVRVAAPPPIRLIGLYLYSIQYLLAGVYFLVLIGTCKTEPIYSFRVKEKRHTLVFTSRLGRHLRLVIAIKVHCL